ncbi:MAG: 16S rRNA (guanine(527)-N(7))-methyltransferase RsmG [Eubacteriales bacterium]|nr:16S rRNA (guanine(527)-N(7))-methyltransferase RsmG [Eubacteriales bacterium]
MNERELLESGLAALALDFSPQSVDNLLRFSELLLEKNKVMNLTAVTDPREVVTRHFLDCAAVIPYMDLRQGRTVLDVGTGAGFPGLPLAVLCPQCEFVLLDAQRKRVDFLKKVIAALGLTNCTAVHARAEDFAGEHRASFDAAVSRAVAELRVLCELALPMVKTGGAFFAMKAADCQDEVDAAANARAVLGAPRAEVFRYAVPVDGVARAVVRLEKTADCPPQYPRRFKKIETQPL